jgi:uncharacterized membrane protein
MESAVPLHPAIVHFAIVLPLVALVFQIVYAIKKEHLYSKIATRTLVIATVFMGIAYYTGTLQGPDVYWTLVEAGQAELKEHKELGLVLLVVTGLTMLLKLFACKKENHTLELVAVGLLLVVAVITFQQGHDGGELTYEYAAGVEIPEDEEDEEDE